LQYYRLSLLPSLLERIHPNLKAGFDEFALFEINKVHSKTELDEKRLPKEFDRVALVFAANDKKAKEYAGASYYRAKKYLDVLIDDSNIKLVPLLDSSLQKHVLTEQMVAPFEPSRSALLYDNENPIGVVGEFKTRVRNNLKLPEYSSGLEVFLSGIPTKHTTYHSLPKFPKVQQDMTLKVSASLPWQDLDKEIEEAIHSLLDIHKMYAARSTINIYQQKKAVTKNVTFRFRIAHHDRTLIAEEVNKLLDDIAVKTKKKFGAERI